MVKNDTFVEIASKILNNKPFPFVRKDVSKNLVNLVEKMLTKNPDERPSIGGILTLLTEKKIINKEMFNLPIFTDMEFKQIQKYEKDFTENSFKEKIKSCFKDAGDKLIYPVLFLFNSMKHSKLPVKAFVATVCALWYFISPIDLITDSIPVIRYMDDAAVLASTVIFVSKSLSPEEKRIIEEKTKEGMKSLF